MRDFLQRSNGSSGRGDNGALRAAARQKAETTLHLHAIRGRGTRRHAQRGFTLLELLIATAVGAVVLIVIQTTFFGALRLHNTTHERIDTDLVVHRTLGIIRRDFAGLMMPGGTLSGQLQTTNFSSGTEGNYGERVTPDIFTNSGKIDGWNPFSEVQMVAYYLAPASGDTEGKDLVRVVTRNLLPVQESIPDEQVLLHGVDSASVFFYDGSGWIDSWDSTVTSTLPRALKFSLVMKTRDAGTSTPPPIELVVPVVVTTRTSEREAEEEPEL
jgi:type II secretion system protein J